MTQAEQRIQQLYIEIQWLKDKLKTTTKPKQIKDINRQITERELNISLGIF